MKALIGIITVTSILGLVLITIVQNLPKDTNTNLSTPDQAIIQEKKKYKLNEKFTYSAWLPEWSGQQGIASVNQNKDSLTSISPVWYEVMPDGSLKDKRPSDYSQIVTLSQQNSLPVIITIQTFDHEILSQVLNNPDNLKKHIQAIRDVATQNFVDGIDINYESTKLSDKEGYFTLLSELKLELSKVNKLLAVTVLPQWGENVIYESLVETREVQDWGRISEIADEVRVMAYDYTWQSSPFAGPIGPLSWHKQIIEYGLTKIPADKFVLSIHLYAYEKFVEREDPSKLGNFGDPRLQIVTDNRLNKGITQPSRAYTFGTVEGIIRDYPNTITETEGEKILKYSKINDTTNKPEDRVVVYIDQNGVKQRVDQARSYGLKGVIFWRLGGESGLLDNLTI